MVGAQPHLWGKYYVDIMLLSLTFALPTSCLAGGEPSLASDHKLVLGTWLLYNICLQVTRDTYRAV